MILLYLNVDAFDEVVDADDVAVIVAPFHASE